MRRAAHALLLALLFGAVPADGPAEVPGWQSKCDRWVIEAAGRGEAEFLVVLREQAVLRLGPGLERRERGRLAVARLREVAARTQGPLVAWLAAERAPHRPFWIANMVLVRGDLALVRALAERDDVARVSANPRVRLAEPVAGEPAGEAPAAIEWGVARVRAPETWAAGFTGQGVVVGGQDTGYDWQHAALRGKYRGWNGSSADHDYNWHDAIHSGGGVCGPDSLEPCDDGDHGTHTMGTMVGDDGAGNQIGVAPGARWIGCRNMDEGVGTPASYTECFQWFVAPTDLSNQNPDPSLAPDVINNSWTCPPSEGCTDPSVLHAVVANTRAAGIVVVASAGNSGPSCSSVSDPPATYGESFSVGATQNAGDAIAGFSSRGPVTVDGSNRMKPDVSAPGVGVRSSVPGGGYGSKSGTSMAGPHAAGVTALLLSALPQLAGQVDALEELIEVGAVPRTSTETCGGIPGDRVPNNTYGFGRVDAFASFQSCPPPTPVIDVPWSVPPDTAGLAASVPVLPGHSYAWSLSGGQITAGQGSAAIVFRSGPPGSVMELRVVDSLLACQSTPGEKRIPTDFLDVPPAHPFHDFVAAITRGGLTGGCGGGSFCPELPVSRAQMAVFLLLARHGRDYRPPPATGLVFLDVAAGDFAAAWIEQLAAEGITGGCGGGRFCPAASVTRETMAVLVLVAREGNAYRPPPATGVFADVPASSPYAPWIEELHRRGVTGGCGGGNYCPGQAISRGQMAVFISLTFEALAPGLRRAGR